MSDGQSGPDELRMVSRLSDAEALRGEGIPELWVEHCIEMVNEYRRLRQRFLELDGRLSPTEGQSPHDTVVF